MRPRRPHPEHQEAVSRRLALLSAELAAVRPPASDAAKDPADRLSAPAPPSAPAVPVPGRHAARRRETAPPLLPDTLRGRVLLGPAQVAVAIKTAIAALEGQVVPQSIRLPLAKVEDPNFKDGENFYGDQSDNFFVGNSFPTCNINFSAQEIMGQTKENQ